MKIAIAASIAFGMFGASSCNDPRPKKYESKDEVEVVPSGDMEPKTKPFPDGANVETTPIQIIEE